MFSTHAVQNPVQNKANEEASKDRKELTWREYRGRNKKKEG